MRRDDPRALAQAARMEASELVKLVSERRPGDTVKVSIARAANSLGWSYSRTEDIWRTEARRIDAWEMDLLRRTAARNLKIPRQKTRR